MANPKLTGGAAPSRRTEAIDTTSASGKLVFHIFAALSEFERTLIQERTKAGLAAARHFGVTRMTLNRVLNA